ncbi:MAG: IPT/TIG domain-containing protein [Rikenellaceae bacterium]
MKTFKKLVSLAALLLAAVFSPSCTETDTDTSTTYSDFTITDFSPKSGGTNTELTITGTNFGDYSKAAKVYIGDLEITDFVSFSDTEIVVVVPSTATSGKIRVTIWTYDHQTTEEFEFIPSPTITSLSNSQTIAGAIISIYGELFGNDVDAVTVYFTAEGDEQYIEGKVQTVTDDEITVEVPVGGTSGPIYLLVDGFNLIEGPSFYYPICIQYLFDTDGDTEGWYCLEGTTTPETLELKVEDGGLKIVYDLVNPADNGTIVYNRVDLAIDNLYMDPAQYPILAVKWTDYPSRTLWLRSAIGDFTNADGKSANGNYDGITGIYQDVIYYDLRNGFVDGDNYGYDPTQPYLLEQLYWTATEETYTGIAYSKIEWINNFESLDALDEYLAGFGESTAEIPTPEITSFNPTVADVGETITIYGSNFGTSIEDITVTFSSKVVAEVTSVTDSQIVVTVPDGGVTGVISVSRIGKIGYTTDEFEYALAANVKFEFDTAGNTEGWYDAGTDGDVTLSVASGALNLAYDDLRYDGVKAQIRADEIVVDPEKYPIIAIKWEDAPTVKCLLNSNKGYYNNDSSTTNHDGIEGLRENIYYYDISKGFGGTSLSTITELEYLEWVIEEDPESTDIATSAIQWIYQFASVDAMQTYLEDIGDLKDGTVATPVISAISKTEGYVGETMTITGSNFGVDTNSITVNFGSTVAPVLSLSDTSIKVMIPDEAEDGQITVSKFGTSEVGTSAESFDYHEPSLRCMFDNGSFDNWQDATASAQKELATLTSENGYLMLNYVWEGISLTYNRLDIANYTAKLDSDVNPILAVKWVGIGDMSTFRLNLQGLGYYMNNTTTSFKVTGKKGADSDVMYFLLTDGFGSGLEAPTAANADSYSYIGFVATMKTSGIESTQVDWVMTFASTTALDQYLAVTGD